MALEWSRSPKLKCGPSRRLPNHPLGIHGFCQHSPPEGRPHRFSPSLAPVDGVPFDVSSSDRAVPNSIFSLPLIPDLASHHPAAVEDLLVLRRRGCGTAPDIGPGPFPSDRAWATAFGPPLEPELPPVASLQTIRPLFDSPVRSPRPTSTPDDRLDQQSWPKFQPPGSTWATSLAMVLLNPRAVALGDPTDTLHHSYQDRY